MMHMQFALLVLHAAGALALSIDVRRNISTKGDTYIFMAGLEGTGHHFWEQIYGRCVRQGSCTQRTGLFYKALWWYKSDPAKLAEAWKEERPGQGAFIPLNTYKPPTPTVYLSYPNGLHDPLEYPQVQNYAKVAQQYGDSLKVVVLLRDPKEIMATDIRWNRTEAQMVEAPRELKSQLLQLAPGDIECQHFEKLTKGGTALAHFLAYPVDEAVLQEFRQPQGCQDCPEAPALAEAQADLERSVCSKL
eukprot:TRINITY_DN24869_c0_g1_i1.p1 TRINITY_DN24869_c0_g1~~TRINITY_DN24869_c0_g1_i1.p1  ORF type:complete len:247 (+),score=48.62 TRINITY_DN24869_c0_g1_i1:115-855(+)